MRSDPIFALFLGVAVSVVSLAALRILDANEREPFWALGVVFACGALAGGIVNTLVGPAGGLDPFETGVLGEGPKLLALATGVAALEVAGRRRGWVEVSGALDGLVYGAAAGFGFATGAAFVHELSLTAALERIADQVGFVGVVATTLVLGIAEGLFGALAGAGVGSALRSRRIGARIALVLAGVALAVLAHALFAAAGDGGVFAQTSASALQVASLLAPLAAVVALAVWARRREQSELQRGRTAEPHHRVLAATRAAFERRAEYLRRFARGDIDGWLLLRSLHNRRVQLALLEGRVNAEVDELRREKLDAQAGRLRASIVDLEGRLARLDAPARRVSGAHASAGGTSAAAVVPPARKEAES